MADKHLIYEEASAMLRNSTEPKVLLNAIMKFESIEDYEDSAQKIEECREKIKSINKEKAQKDAEDKKQEEIVQKKTNKKNAIIGVIVIIIITVGIVAGITINSVTHKNNYAVASKMLEEGNYNDAYELFNKLGEYEDSQKQANESLYRLAKQQIKDKEYIKAHDTLTQLGNYGDSADVLKKIISPYRKEIIKNASAKDVVIWGKYEQDNNKTNGKEDIEWIVLDKKGNKVLLLSKYIIDEKPYSKNPAYAYWSNSSIRKWLNDDFYNKSFTKSEKEIITKTTNTNNGNTVDSDRNDFDIYSTPKDTDTKDNVFLLSVDEVKKYLTDARVIETRYAYVQISGSDDNYDANYTENSWWLRSIGHTYKGNKNNDPAYVPYCSRTAYDMGSNGSDNFIINDIIYVHKEQGVRPAMWVDVSK